MLVVLLVSSYNTLGLVRIDEAFYSWSVLLKYNFSFKKKLKFMKILITCWLNISSSDLETIVKYSYLTMEYLNIEFKCISRKKYICFFYFTLPTDFRG